jgi:hypothetical protein
MKSEKSRRPPKAPARNPRTRGTGRRSTPTKGITKRVRLEAHRAKIVERIARTEDKSESDVLREGIDLLERVRARRANVPSLLEFIREPAPPKTRFALK